MPVDSNKPSKKISERIRQNPGQVFERAYDTTVFLESSKTKQRQDRLLLVLSLFRVNRVGVRS
jgi:hypothetical protein